jgi:hypothetical protein
MYTYVDQGLPVMLEADSNLQKYFERKCCFRIINPKKSGVSIRVGSCYGQDGSGPWGIFFSRTLLDMPLHISIYTRPLHRTSGSMQPVRPSIAENHTSHDDETQKAEGSPYREDDLRVGRAAREVMGR